MTIMTPADASRLYTQALNSDIEVVIDFALTAMQNAVDQCGKIGQALSQEQTEVFVCTLKMGLDSASVDETLLRWFATRGMRS